MKITLLFDGLICLQNILDDCRVSKQCILDYEDVLELALTIENQASRKYRCADIVTFELTLQQALLMWSCIIACEIYGCTTRTLEEIKTLEAELNTTCPMADVILEGLALITE